MKFEKDDPRINRGGRPKGSVNNSSKLKKEIETLLGEFVFEKLTSDELHEAWSKASPSSRLKFIEGVLAFLIPKPQKGKDENDKPTVWVTKWSS